MAITKEHPQLKAEVFVNGAPLREYDDDEDADMPTTVTKYIEATTGANFDCRYTFSTTFPVKHAVVAQVYVDGKYCDSHVLHADERDWVGAQQIMRGVREATGTTYAMRKFCFSDLKTDDSGSRNDVDALMKQLKNIGIITMKFKWITVHGPSHRSRKPSSDIADVGAVPEKALKGRALSNQVSLGVREPIDAVNSVETSDVYGNTFFATFNFKYRSKKDLQSLLILPRSPSPVPLEERDVDSLSPEEMRELLKRQKERDEAARRVKIEGRVKREHANDRSDTMLGGDDDSEVSFVSEKRRKLNVSIDESGVETIDLT